MCVDIIRILLEEVAEKRMLADRVRNIDIMESRERLERLYEYNNFIPDDDERKMDIEMLIFEAECIYDHIVKPISDYEDAMLALLRAQKRQESFREHYRGINEQKELED